MLDKFIELLKQSVVLQASLTVMIWGVMMYLIVIGRPVPDILLSAGNIILGFYFGSKSQLYINNARAHQRKDDKTS